MIDFLQNLLNPITSVLGGTMLFFHDHGVPWWLSIALLTLVVRTLLFPLTIKQVRSMRAMQDLKPEMNRLKTKYKDDRQKQQAEIMKLYQEREINPLGGCLPLLVQLPIFMGLFYVIREFGGSAGLIGGGGGAGSQPSFTSGGILWFTDLTMHDSFFILPIISAVTMLLSMEITNKSVDPQQRWLMRVLPFGLTFFTWRFPAALFMYWITSNLITLGQNYLIYSYGAGRRQSSEQQTTPSGKKLTQEPTSESQNNSQEKLEQKPKGNSRRRRKKRR